MAVTLWRRSRFYATLISTAVLNLRPVVALRGVCGPAMNCHGCPAATTACPVGVVSYGSAIHAFPAMAIGTLLAVGILFGRLVCAFACPFGLLQDLLHRIPGPKLRLPRWWRWGKYACLALLVVALPFAFGFQVDGFLAFDKPKVDKADSDIKVTVTVRNPSPEAVRGVQLDLVWNALAEGGAELARLPQAFPEVVVEPGAEAVLPVITIPNRLGEGNLSVASPLAQVRQDPGLHYFCTLCPTGSLEAVVLPPLVRGEAPSGWADRNAVRLGVLAGFLALMWLASRPFCRGFCPLGAFYGLTARFAITRMGIDRNACIECGACNRVCPAELDVPREVGGPECIACGDCMTACSQNGIHRTFGLMERKKT
jgi:ferredoxin